MKNFLILILLALTSATFAQTILDVPPGNGTLNDSINVHQGNVIYRLQAGGWYGLNAIIENNGFALTIIGTTPAPGQMPAMLQTGTNPDGTVLTYMFNQLGDLTLRNIFIVNADANGDLGPLLVWCQPSQSVRTVIDSVTVDPCGLWAIFNITAPWSKLFITNSKFLRIGTLTSPYDGNLIDMAGAANNGFDTLYIENNTFVSTGMLGAINSHFTSDSENVVWVNHNSFIFHKQQLLWMWHMNKYFLTNNLFFDYDVSPTPYQSNFSFPDGDTTGHGSLLAWVNQDTTSSDSANGKLLSQRELFVEYNSVYTDPRIQDLVTWAAAHTVNNDGVTPIPKDYLMHLMYPADSAGVNREAQMCSDKAHFPYFYEGNYLDNLMGSNPNTDPQFNDSRFYNDQDSLVSWAFADAELNIWNFSSALVNPPLQNAGNWFWCLDSTYNIGNPTAWPRVDASYKNSSLLTASIEGLPLGDLNWFPAQKAIWQKNQASIMTHILDENTSVLNITEVKQKNNQTPTTFSLLQNYPNPFNPSTEIKYSIPNSGLVTLKVYNLLGQEIATLVNQKQKSGVYTVNFDASKLASGVYMYRIQDGNFSLTKKMMLLK